jgi:sortase A
MERPSRRILVERLAWVVGSAAVATWAFFYFSGVAGARRELSRFTALRAAGHLEAGLPDQTLWSSVRKQAWRETVAREAPAPLAVLRIPRLGLEVAVLEGTDDWTLNRAVGHIADTAAPGAEGNSGIAGHRDGFFRGLKDVAPGDAVELETIHGTELYRIEGTWIVDPENVSVLDPDPTFQRSVTLVTCYPFYFVGPAPQRFIVRAVWRGHVQAALDRHGLGHGFQAPALGRLSDIQSAEI